MNINGQSQSALAPLSPYRATRRHNRGARLLFWDLTIPQGTGWPKALAGYAAIDAEYFGPIRLMEFRAKLVDKGLVRKYVNRLTMW